MEEVPRCTSLASLASPSFVLCLVGVETEGLSDYQERAGIIPIVWWNRRPVIFGVETPGHSARLIFEIQRQMCLDVIMARHEAIMLRELHCFNHKRSLLS